MITIGAPCDRVDDGLVHRRRARRPRCASISSTPASSSLARTSSNTSAPRRLIALTTRIACLGSVSFMVAQLLAGLSVSFVTDRRQGLLDFARNGYEQTMSSFPPAACAAVAPPRGSASLLAEHRLHPSDLIWPLFIADGQGLRGADRLAARRVALERRPAGRARPARRAISASRASRFSPIRPVTCAPTTRARRSIPTTSSAAPSARSRMRFPRSESSPTSRSTPTPPTAMTGCCHMMLGSVINDPTGRDAGRPGAGPGRRRRRHRRPVGHDGRPRRRDPLRARSARAIAMSRSWPMPPNMPRPSTARSATRSDRAGC